MSALPVTVEQPVEDDTGFGDLGPGVYSNDELSNEDYHAMSALSSTGAKVLALQSAYHYRYQRENPSEPTPSMRLGTAVHTGVLEPDKFKASVVAVPADAPQRPTSAQRNAKKPSESTLASIAWWNDFEKRTAGKLVLSADEFERAQHMIASVQRHDHAMALLEDGRTELSLLWQDGAYDVPCRCRFDFFGNNMVAADLKTTVDASPEGFARQAANLAYHLSAAFYWSGAEAVLNESPRAWFWICVENVAPYATAVYACEMDALRAGMRLVNVAMGRFRVARRSKYWDAYPGVKPLKFPRYALMHPTEE